MIKILSIVFFLLAVSCNPSLAAVSFGTSMMYTKINDPVYKYTNELEQAKLTSLTIGYFKEFDNKISVGAYTNRFLNKGLKRKVKANATYYNNETRTKFDAIQIGYRIKRVMPSLFIANTEVDKKLFYNGTLVGRQTNHIYTYGGSINYFVDKKTSVGLTYIAPNEEINMEGGIGLGINFLI